MVIISICNIKGGVGKTMTCYHLANAISKNGQSVLCIDNDSQCSLTSAFQIDTSNIDTMYELYTNNKVKFSDCIISVRDNISLLPNHKKSKDIENRLNTRTFKEIILKNKIETLPSCYDIVLIDNTPFAGVTLNNSLGMSDYYLGVVDNCGDALHGLERISEIADDVRDCHLNQNLKPVGILMNDFDKTSNISKQYINQLQDQYKELIFDTRIYHSVKYKSAILDNKSIYELDKNLGLNFDSLYQELVSRLSIRV